MCVVLREGVCVVLRESVLRKRERESDMMKGGGRRCIDREEWERDCVCASTYLLFSWCTLPICGHLCTSQVSVCGVEGAGVI